MKIEEFLADRIGEDIEAALAASIDTLSEEWIVKDESYSRDVVAKSSDANVTYGGIEGLDDSVTERVGAHIARFDPARIQRECEAKRRIIDAHTSQIENDDDMAWIVATEVLLHALALPYANHPDYQTTWSMT